LWHNGDKYMHFYFYNDDLGCDGLGPNDENVASNEGWICKQQVGSTYDSGYTYKPIYAWGNVYKGGAPAGGLIKNSNGSTRSDTYHVKANLNFFNCDSAADCKSDNDLVDIPGYGTNSGWLYPGMYTYPHPLRGGAVEPAAPTPDPMTWAIEPAASVIGEISMTGSTCNDDTPPIDYYFYEAAGTCGADHGTGGSDSGAQESDTTFTDDTLQPNKCYSYTCKACDSDVPTCNTVSASSELYTLCNVPIATTFENEADNTAEILVFGANSNPAANPTTTFALQMVATSPADADWQDKWVQADGTAGASAAWMTEAAINALTLSGLNTTTLYGLKSKAKNADGIETALGAEGQFTTTGTPPPITNVSGLQINGCNTR